MSLQSIVQQVFPHFLYEPEPETVEVRAVPVLVRMRDWEGWGDATFQTPGLATNLYIDNTGMVWVYVHITYHPRRHQREEEGWVELGRISARTFYVEWCDYKIGRINDCAQFEAITAQVYASTPVTTPAQLLSSLSRFLQYV